MTIKKMFKMIENVNVFNELIGSRKRFFINLTDDRIFELLDENGNWKFYKVDEIKKALNYTYNEEAIEKIMNADFVQDEKYKSCFEFEKYKIAICEE